MTMDLEVPLKRLIFGQEDGAGINARITGRDDGIAELAANINARGQIENLVVKRVAGVADELYSVSNGNRRLAAFRMIYGEDSSQSVRCTLRDVDEDGAFEDSLTTAVTAKQLHPVDQYEAFARLRDKGGKTIEEIARHYGMSEREVEQALALGHLSPRIRECWRKGEIKTEVAKAFTLAPDHKMQDSILDGFAERSGDLIDFGDYDVKNALKLGNNECGVLVEFVGIEAYVARGGKVTRDLFGTDHQVSDPKLVKKMATEKLAAECKKLKDAGWSFAITTPGNTRYDYSRLKADRQTTDEEQQRLAELNAIFNKGEARDGYYHADSFAELTGAEQKAYLAYLDLDRAIELRAYSPKMMEKAGCFVDVDDDGFLKVEYGYVKPAEKKAAAKIEKAEKRELAAAASKSSDGAGKPGAESTTLSNALKERLEIQLVSATKDAIAGEPQLVNSPLFEMLARIICTQIVSDRVWGTPDAVRTKLPSIRQVLNAAVFNAALAKRFDAEDYFSSAPKSIVVKAIAEAINPDEARKTSAGKSKAEIWKFALANVGKTGWLPKELRTVHYAGPGSEGYKRPQLVPGASTGVTAPTPKSPAKPPVKRAAVSKKAAKKTSANKRKA
jgi:ParB family chromosome partitioning protein